MSFMIAPDILLIVLDTQRADRLGCYGYERSITPHLDNFAQTAVVFEQAISPAQWTVPSHASLFTGQYPTIHQVLQSHQALSPQIPHLAEIAQSAGYQTVGFCNNPLVGILNNGLKRGFETFYNYGGAFPSLPEDSISWPWPLDGLVEQYSQFLRRLSYPIQNFFGRSDLAFQISLNAWLTPLWSKLAHFKGQNARSVADVVRFLRQRDAREEKRPLFLFLNLMETHLPFWPPGEFVDRVAPYFRQSAEAREIMRRWNREAYRWAAPLTQPLGELEAQVLSDMYDAEVAYQDDYLGPLWATINGRSRSQHTFTTIVSDHGDGLGEHGYMGHAFNAYQELVHVPLIMHWPAHSSQPSRIPTPVSTRRVFHTLTEAISLHTLPKVPHLNLAETTPLSLWQTVRGHDPEQGLAYSEIYPPLNFVKAIERRQPQLLAQFGCQVLRRGVVGDINSETYKLIQVADQPNELFDLAHDPLELTNELGQRPLPAHSLNTHLNQFKTNLQSTREQFSAGDTIEPEMDEHLIQQLRGLGYLE